MEKCGWFCTGKFPINMNIQDDLQLKQKASIMSAFECQMREVPWSLPRIWQGQHLRIYQEDSSPTANLVQHKGQLVQEKEKEPVIEFA